MSLFDPFSPKTLDSKLHEDATYLAPGFLLPTTETEDTVEEERETPRSFIGLIVLVIAVIGVLAIQAFRLQIIEGNTNRTLAEGNSVRLITLPADRGLIQDSSGAILAQNGRQLALSINPQTLPAQKSERQKVYDYLKEKAGISQSDIDLIEDERLKSPEIFPIKTNLSKDESLLYKEWFANTPGVTLQDIPIRLYAEMPSGGHILGYVGRVTEEDLAAGYKPDDRIGKTGLEENYDSLLAGTPGKQKAEVNASGEIVRTLPGGIESKPQAGQTLRLSIDSKLQGIVATALKNELDRRTKKFGELKDLGASAVVLDPATGAVRAMVSLPDYNDQLFAKGISATEYKLLTSNPGNPLLNRAIQGQYPSGSIIKPLIAAAALEAGVINEKTQLVTPDAIVIGDFRFPDWKLHTGPTDVRRAIAESNDIFFYSLGGGWPEKKIKGLGIDLLNKDLNAFGLGQSTHIDLPGESNGLIATPEWKQKNLNEAWYIGDTYHTSIGQGFTLVTPLQMAVSTAAIVNGGTVWQPSLAWSTIDSNGKETLLPHKALNSNFISAHNLDVTRQGMRDTVLYGSGRPLGKLKVTSAGKTGTAEFGDKGLTHAWYTGFAPYENPELVFAILIEGGGESFYSSVPVAEEILRGYFNEPLAPGEKLFSGTEDPTVKSEFTGEH